MTENGIRKIKFKPTQSIALGFFSLIVICTALLMLPISSADGQSLGAVDSLFTSTSAVCVTGLVVRNTMEQWSLFGKIVILIAIQIGGLGFITMTTSFFLMLGKKITLRERILIQESFNQENLSGMVTFVKRILRGTFIIETIGAILLSIQFIPDYGLIKGIWYSIFHSITAFCNAGFDIIGGDSLTPYANNLLVNFVLMALIILGGIGFPVWADVVKVIREKIKNKWSIKRTLQKLSLHSKLAITITLALIFVGSLFFFVVEYDNPNTIGNMSLGNKILASSFLSVTFRTAGFANMNLAYLTEASMFFGALLMIIGGSPAGTAGGIKTVTMGILFLEIASTIRGKSRPEAFGRTLPSLAVKRALAVFSVSLVILLCATMLLSLSQDGTFLQCLFETGSAFGTTGLTAGLTPLLDVFGKMIIVLLMYIGRIGPITMAVAFTLKSKDNKAQVILPEEKIIVG